jgi:hypothetical protein
LKISKEERMINFEQLIQEIYEEAKLNLVCLFDGDPVCVELSEDEKGVYDRDWGSRDDVLTVWNEYTEENDEVRIHLHSYSGGVEVTAI